MKIAFLTSNNARDRRSFSSTHFYMGEALLRHGFEVSFIGPLKPWEEFIGRAINKISQKILKKKFRYLHTPYLAKRYARMAEKKMKGIDFDFIFAPAGSKETAYLKTNVPIIYTSDVTWKLLNNYYSKFSNMLGLSIKQGNVIEKRAIQNASLLPYPTHWVADSVINDYGGNPSRVSIIPWGGNIDNVPSREVVLARKKSKECRLFFIGVHWQRKGGEIAYQTILELEKLGINAHLTICGVVPPPGFEHPRIEVIPYLSKQNEEERKRFEELYLTSDFFLLPTRAEAYGMSLCEAASFGLPAIATHTGGIVEVVKDGVTGFLLPIEAKGANYAKLIKEIYEDDARYMKMVIASRNHFEETLNWDSWAKSFMELLKNYKATQK